MSALRAGRGEPQPMARSHSHADVEINYVFGGDVHALVGGLVRTLRPGAFVVFWGAMPHQVLGVSEDAEYAWLTVPLSRVLSWELDGSFAARLLKGEALIDAHTRAADASMVRRWMDASTAERAPLDARGIEREIEARLRRLEPHGEDPGRRVTSRSLELVERVTTFLGAHYLRPIGLADVGRAVSLHPSYALTTFRRACGLTVGQYLTRLRVAEAQRILLTTCLPIDEVARRAGFGSPSNFYELFTRECGMSPGAFRRRG